MSSMSLTCVNASSVLSHISLHLKGPLLGSRWLKKSMHSTPVSLIKHCHQKMTKSLFDASCVLHMLSNCLSMNASRVFNLDNIKHSPSKNIILPKHLTLKSIFISKWTNSMASHLKPTDIDRLSISSDDSDPSPDNISNPSNMSKGDDTLYSVHKSRSMPPPKAMDTENEEHKTDIMSSTSATAYSLGSAAYNYMSSFYPQQTLTAASRQDPKSQSLSAIERLNQNEEEQHAQNGQQTVSPSQALPDHLHSENDQKMASHSPPKWMEIDLINYPLCPLPFCLFVISLFFYRSICHQILASNRCSESSLNLNGFWCSEWRTKRGVVPRQKVIYCLKWTQSLPTDCRFRGLSKSGNRPLPQCLSGRQRTKQMDGNR